MTATNTGQRLIAKAAGIALTAAMVWVIITAGPSLALSLLSPLIPVIVIVIVCWLGSRMLLRVGRKDDEKASGSLLGGLASGLGRGIAKVVGAPLRFAPGEREYTAEVRRFRVTEVSGRQVDCELVGSLIGASPRQGDIVEVFGRSTKQGAVRVQEMVITANQARVRARPGIGFLLARYGNVAVAVIAAGCLLLLVISMTTR